MHLKKKWILSIILALIPYFIISKSFASDSSDTVGSRRRSQKQLGIPAALLKPEGIFPKNFPENPYISTEQLLKLTKNSLHASRPIKGQGDNTVLFSRMSKTVVEEGFIVIIDIRNPFNCLEKDFKLYRSVAEDEPLLSDKKLPGFVKENHIKNPLNTIVGNFYVTILVRAQGKFSEERAIKLKAFMENKDQIIHDLPSTLRDGKQAPTERLRQLMVRSLPAKELQAQGEEVKETSEQEIKSVSSKAHKVKEKIKKSENPFKAGSPPLEASLKDRMQKLASSTRLAKGPGLPVGVKDLKKAKLSSQQTSEIKGLIKITSSQDDTSTSKRRAVFETRSRSASFSEKRSPSIVSSSNSRSATPFSGVRVDTRARAGSIDESASIRSESLSLSPVKKAAAPKAISKKKSKKRTSGSSSSSQTD